MNSNIDLPQLGRQRPLYPQATEIIRVTATKVAGPSGIAQVAGSSVLAPMLYVAFVQQIRTDGSLLPRDRIPCLADDVNGLGLAPGYYEGRLSSSFNSLPVYVVGVAATSGGSSGGSSGPITTTTITLPQSATPPPPPAGNLLLYAPSLDVSNLYIEDSLGVTRRLGGLHPWDALQAGPNFGGQVGAYWHLASQFRIGAALSGGFVTQANYMWAVPFLPLRGCTIDQMAIHYIASITTNYRLGIYRSTATPGDLYPGALVYDYGTIGPFTVVGGSGDKATLVNSVALAPNTVYWAAICFDATATSITALLTSDSVPTVGFQFGSLSTGTPVIGLYTPNTFGALPSTFPAITTPGTTLVTVSAGTNDLPAIWFYASK